MHPLLYAFTVQQPWAWCIISKDKRIENRSWRPPDCMIGQRVAIHAGRHFDDVGLTILEDKYGLTPDPKLLTRGCIIGLVTLASIVQESADRWFTGPYGWKLRDIIQLPIPVPCAGRLGFWLVSDSLIEEIERQLKIKDR